MRRSVHGPVRVQRSERETLPSICSASGQGGHPAFLVAGFPHPCSLVSPHCCVQSMPERAGKREGPSEPSWGQLGDDLPEDAIGEQETRGQGSVTPQRSPKVLPTTTRSFPKGERLLRFVLAQKSENFSLLHIKTQVFSGCHRSRGWGEPMPSEPQSDDQGPRVNLSGRQIRRLRRKRGWTLADVQAALEEYQIYLDRTSLGRIERGTQTITDREFGALPT